MDWTGRVCEVGGPVFALDAAPFAAVCVAAPISLIALDTLPASALVATNTETPSVDTTKNNLRMVRPNLIIGADSRMRWEWYACDTERASLNSRSRFGHAGDQASLK